MNVRLRRGLIALAAGVRRGGANEGLDYHKLDLVTKCCGLRCLHVVALAFRRARSFSVQQL